MARVKKEREAQIIHFSFFDLLFGAFGAFVFLMLMHVLSTMNLVQADLQASFDAVVEKKNALAVEVTNLQAEREKLTRYEQLYQEAMTRLSRVEQENRLLADERNEAGASIASLRSEVASLSRLKEELLSKGDLRKALEEENEQLKKRLAGAEQDLARLRPVPLRMKTAAIPATLTGEDVRLAMAAEGGSPPYTWDLRGSLPAGLTLDRANGMFVGRTRRAGRFPFTLSVVDARGARASSCEIAMVVADRPGQKKEGVSEWFAIMGAVIFLLLAYILFKRYQAHRHYKKMVADGWELMWNRKQQVGEEHSSP